jgi:drug/metabolite transporter (DMT)-like permease
MINEAKSTKVFGYISAFTSAILMGTIGVFVRNISSNAQIITFSRLFLGLLFLSILLLFTRRYEEVKVKLTLPLFFSGVFMSLAILFYIESINHTTLANAVILLYIGPLIATVLAHFLLKERVKLINIVLIVVAFSGVGFLFKSNFSFDLENNYGYIFGIISAIWYSFYIIANRKISKNIPIVSRSFYQFFFGALLMSPI